MSKASCFAPIGFLGPPLVLDEEIPRQNGVSGEASPHGINHGDMSAVVRIPFPAETPFTRRINQPRAQSTRRRRGGRRGRDPEWSRPVLTKLTSRDGACCRSLIIER